MKAAQEAFNAGTTAALARFAARLSYQELPPTVVAKAKEVLTDSIGCLLGGYTLELAAAVVNYAREQGGNPEARILGSNCVLGCSPATFANAELMNALDFDEVLLNWNHTAPYVIPPALAIAERRGASGQQLLHALVVGYEVATRVCSALGGSIVVTGQPPNLSAGTPAVSGFSPNVFGAAAAVGVLLGFDAIRMANAFGLAGYNSPVLNSIKWSTSPPVPMSKYGIAGWIAQTGLTAALLTESGFTGDTTVLDGPHGFARMIGAPRWCEGDILADLGERWWILQTSFKAYPCCRFMHHGMDLVADIVARNHLNPESIENIRVGSVARTAATSVFTTVVPRDAMDAQFSVPYVIAASAYQKHHFPDLLAKETLVHPGILRLASKVETVPEPRQIRLRYERYGNEAVGALDRAPTSVEILMRDGRRYSSYGEFAKGDPTESTRLTHDEMRDKFLRCAAAALPRDRAEAAFALLATTDDISDIRELTRALVPRLKQ